MAERQDAGILSNFWFRIWTPCPISNGPALT